MRVPSLLLLTPYLASLALLASCSSAPKPPLVDESHKRPVNTVAAVDLQVCKNELRNAQILNAETERVAVNSATALAKANARQQVLANLQAATQHRPQGNIVFNVTFEFASSRVDISSDAARPLIEEAKKSPFIVLRGRTDGANDSISEGRVARDRSSAVRDYLVAAGVDPARIRVTYQPSGDHAADNSSRSGRAINRRVEIEMYHAVPVALVPFETQQ
jgi:outer membrane protein OmpA-like peptidoglycan-associated protein